MEVDLHNNPLVLARKMEHGPPLINPNRTNLPPCGSKWTPAYPIIGRILTRKIRYVPHLMRERERELWKTLGKITLNSLIKVNNNPKSIGLQQSMHVSLWLKRKEKRKRPKNKMINNCLHPHLNPCPRLQ